MYAYIKFGENMSSSSLDIERKPKFGVNQGSFTLKQMFEKMICNNLKLDHVNINAQIKFR